MNLLIACYELGHQPLSLAWPLAFLKRAGLNAATLDLAVQPFADSLAAHASFVGIAAPMHTALRLGARAARRVRAVNPGAHICFFGLYAWLNEDYLLNGIADSVIGGEYEEPLLKLIEAIQSGNLIFAQIPGVSTPSSRALPALNRLAFPVPDRSQLPPLHHYAHYLPPIEAHHGPSIQTRHDSPRSEAEWDGASVLSGYVEASRGCLRTCRHCPIVPIYHGRFFVIPSTVVLADIRQQVAAGARHITFGDPDFLNGPKHSLQIAHALHQEFPYLTFDFTTKVEHILKHRQLFPEFAALGCTFVVSAIESLSDHVLQKLAKGHTAADIDAALAILDAAGITLQPTLVAFTPWTTLADYLAQIEWIHARGLAGHIPPIQLAIRLLIPPRSALLSLPDTSQWLGELDPASFTYRWKHPDPRLDQLYSQISNLVLAQATQHNEPALITHHKIRETAYQLAGLIPAPRFTFPPNPRRPRPAPPRLTENWFC